MPPAAPVFDSEVGAMDFTGHTFDYRLARARMEEQLREAALQREIRRARGRHGRGGPGHGPARTGRPAGRFAAALRALVARLRRGTLKGPGMLRPLL
ncbi:hypothetical protein U7230_03095 [Carboxydochorda subterranea]|uniref:Uncharacterized protein n=1 Tax=Carboxydichorda subterranea TaxID=3109565 RepID=A0ABZ1BYW2_9FIRM|nr:hypothetical protein [Limnochorda sp. L945t]WRP18009.1 hypothetical protein U7230_03095 [Limnochorda sp. L945t]